MHELPPHLVIQRVLGEGGTSIVYQALHTRLKVPVAVKVLARLEHHEREAGERLLREAELCARLTDPRFPRIYDVDQLEDGTPYMVMEHISGRNLAELIAHGPFDVDTAWAITREVLEALMDIHELGVIHRDIKPANILIESREGREQRVRIVDFGIAKSTDIGAPVEALTEQGAMVGTPHYMAPEQMRGSRLDARVDLYAVGSVLYEMLTGRPAFDGGTIGEVIAATLRDDPAPVSSMRDDVPDELEAFIRKAMARDRRDRFATAHEMLCALHTARLPALPRLSQPVEQPVLIAAEQVPVSHQDAVAFPREESGTRPIALKPSLLIVPEPLEIHDGTPRPRGALDTSSYRRPRRVQALWKAAIAVAALTVPLWPTRLEDLTLDAGVVSAYPANAAPRPAAQPTPEPPQAAPEQPQAPASSPFSISSAVPQPIVILPREDAEPEEPARPRSRRQRARSEERTEAARNLEPVESAQSEDEPSEPITPTLRVRTPESLPERQGALPSNPY